MNKVKLLLLLLVTLSLGLLAACGDDVNPQDVVDEANELVAISFATGDSATNVTRNVTLPSAEGDVAITWTSSNPAVLSAAGVVTRGAADVNVVLTATLTFEEISVTKPFNLTIKGDQAIADQEAVAAAKTQLAVTYASGDTAAAVTQNVTLPVLVNGVTVTWATSHAAYITNAGVVARGMANQVVTLTATLTKGANTDTKVFSVTVLFDQNLVDADAVANAKAALEIGFAATEDAVSVTQNLTLPTQIGDVTITWATSNAAAVTMAGVVNQTSANQMATLTATLTLGDQTDTKVFQLTVLHDQALLDAELVAAAANSIAVGFAATEEAATVTQNVTLPSTIGDVTVVWSSSNAAVISNAGVVNQGLLDASVTLTATLTKGDSEEVVTFELVVLLDQTLVDAELTAAVSALNTLFADTIGNDLYEVTEDLNLVVTINDYVVSWTSSNVDLVATDGTVVRPDWTEDGGDTAILTATITVGADTEEVTFFAFVKSLDKTLEQVLTEALLIVTAFPVVEGITADQTFPATTTYQETVYDVTWVSDSPEYLSNSGVVTQPAFGEAAVLAHVTVSITVGETTVSRVIDFNVLAEELGSPRLNIADAIANSAKDDYIMIPGVTALAKYAGGIYFSDETGIMYVYDTTIIYSQVVVGEVYDLHGSYTVYYNSPEMLQVSAAQPLAIFPSDALPSMPEAITGWTIDEITALSTPGGSGVEIFFDIYEVTGKVIKDTALGTSYSVFLVDPSYDGTTVVANATTKEYYTDTLLVYYGSNVSAFDGFIGKVVTVEIMILGFRTDLITWYGGFNGTVSDIVEYIPETDQGKVELDKSFVALPDEINLNETIVLPVLGQSGSTITWESSHPEVISTAGVVAVPEVGVTVTLTATFTLNDAITTKVFEIVVQEIVLTVSEVRAKADGNLVITTGLITSIAVEETGNGDDIVAFIQDETAGVYVYKVPATYASLMVVGNIVKIYGELDIFNSIIQVRNISDVKLVSTDNVVTPLVVTDPAEIINVQGQLVEVSGYLKQVVTTGSDFFLVTENGQFQLVVAGTADLNTAARTAITDALYNVAEGTMITVVGGASRYSISMQIMLFDAADITIGTVGTELQLGEAALGNLNIPEASAELTGNLVLPTTGLFGTTITWGSDNEAVISTTGTVVRPEEGLSDAPVVLSYTVINGATTVYEGTINFTVLAQGAIVEVFASDLFISEYMEGSSNNKYIEIYNGTGGAVDLSGYTVNLYGNGSAVSTQTLALTGTLAHGEVYVIANASANATILAAADITSAITFYNGDDAVALLKGETVIDVIGVIGTDPGSNWPVNDGFTNEFTLVRVATVLGPNAVFTEAEWAVFPQDTVTDIGVHTMTPPTAQVFASDLFISEYMEGSSNNKYIEIYNGTGGAVDLSGYTVNLYGNGSAVSTQTLALTGTLAHGEVYVIANASANATILAAADITSAITFYNGDDAVALLKGETVIDVIGVIGTDPGSNWPVNDGFTNEFTLVRVATVLGPNAVFTEAEWAVFPQDTVTDIGVHTMTPPTAQVFASDLFISEYMEGSSNNKYIEIYNGTGGAVDLSGYTVNLYGNGSAVSTQTLALTGTLAHGEVYVIANASANATILAAADITSAITFYNGDDAVALLKGETVIDVIGVIGTDPGSNWPVNDGFTNEFTLVRVATVLGPNAVFTEAEWAVFPQDTVTDIGVHTMN